MVSLSSNVRIKQIVEFLKESISNAKNEEIPKGNEIKIPVVYGGATPRLKSPRKKVDSGHIGIAGSQTGIYPLSSPGGWNLIGKTPVDVFDIDNPTSSKIKMGDRLKFIPIDESKFENY